MTDTENKNSLKEISFQMYENTINEMRDRGIDTSIIEKEYEDTKKAYEHPEEFSRKTLEMPESTIYSKNYTDYKGNVIDITSKHHDFNGLLMQNLYIVRFFDIPEYLIRRVFFEDDNVLRIGLYESNSFCVYDYIRKNKNKIKGTFSIEYVDKTGALLRIDTYELKSIGKIRQFPLDYSSDAPVYLEVEIKYNKHDITTK